MDIRIRPFQTMADAEGIVEVQRQAWQMADLGIVPTFETRAVADAGFVYVAEHDHKVIGFIYGYHHFPDIHYSHMMAVLPEYHSQSVGYKLKQYHRQQALQSPYPVQAVQWTVDPLLPNNAYLNFAKLGGYCDIYKINYYGDPDSDGVEIYAGVPTDRFKLTWPIHARRVARRMEDYKPDRLTYIQLLEQVSPINHIQDFEYEGSTQVPEDVSRFLVEVPVDYQYIRRHAIDKAMDWRLKFREICLTALEQDFVVADYHHVTDNGTPHNFYEFCLRDAFDGFE